MTSINQVFGHPSTPALVNKSHPCLITDDKVGIEVELEGLTPGFRVMRQEADPRWDVIEDGSLRNRGMEFVFGVPMYGADVVETVTSLIPLFQRLNVTPVLSERTSVHVHLDVRDLEYSQLLNLVLVYLLCEPYFFAVGGEDRKNNAYTTPLAQSENYLTRLGIALRSGDTPDGDLFRSRINSDVKYSAFNVAPVITQGSVEFRHHRGTYDTGTILNWVNMVLAVKRYTVALGSNRMTTEFIDGIVNGNYEEFIEQVFRGVNVPSYVDGWSNAARVAKRVATIAQGQVYRTPLLPTKDAPHDTLFAVAQREIAEGHLGDMDDIVSILVDDVGVDTEEPPIPPRVLTHLYSNFLHFNQQVDSGLNRLEFSRQYPRRACYGPTVTMRTL